jgi:HK97 gp10 family phage protein
MANEIKVEGLIELQKMLDQLPAKLEANIMRGGLRAASNIYRDRARSNVPKKSGDLRKSIKVSTSNKKGTVSATISAGDNKAFYAHMIEFGTASFFEGSGKSVGGPYKIPGKSKGGKSTRKKKAVAFGDSIYNNVTHPGIRPVGYMRNAFDQGTSEVMEALRLYIGGRIGRELLK